MVQFTNPRIQRNTTNREWTDTTHNWFKKQYKKDLIIRQYLKKLIRNYLKAQAILVSEIQIEQQEREIQIQMKYYPILEKKHNKTHNIIYRKLKTIIQKQFPTTQIEIIAIQQRTLTNKTTKNTDLTIIKQWLNYILKKDIYNTQKPIILTKQIYPNIQKQL